MNWCKWCHRNLEGMRSDAAFCCGQHRLYWNRHRTSRDQWEKTRRLTAGQWAARNRKEWPQPWQNNFTKQWLVEQKRLADELDALYRKGKEGLGQGRFAPEAARFVSHRLELLIRHAQIFQAAMDAQGGRFGP